MEFWILYALISAVSAGIANFGVKIMVERKLNIYLFSFYGNALAFLYLGAILIFNGTIGSVIGNISPFILLLAFVNIFLLILSVNTRAVSLRNIDTVIFYPIYKTLGPIIMTLISVLYFKETLELNESLGILLGIFVPLLLITKKENTIQKNLFIGLGFIVATVFLTSLGMVMPKIIQVNQLDVNSFLLGVFGLGVLVTALLMGYENYRNEKTYNSQSFYFWIFFCSFHFFAMYFFTHALTGNLAIVFTINSFSILIPIILSIIFYGEHFNLKKGIVIALSIVSILLFI